MPEKKESDSKQQRSGDVYNIGDLDHVRNVVIGRNARLIKTQDPKDVEKFVDKQIKEIGLYGLTIEQLEQMSPPEEHEQKIAELEALVAISKAEGTELTLETVIHMAKLAAYKGDRQQAVDYYKQAFELAPEQTNFLLMAGWMEHNQALSELSKQPPDYQAALRYVRQARETITQVLMVFPKDMQARAQLAYCVKTRSQIAKRTHDSANLEKYTAEAGELFQQLLKVNPRDAGALNGLANILLMQKRYDEAINYSRRAIAVDWDYPSAYLDLGIACYGKLQRMGHTDEWYDLYETALIALDQAHDLAASSMDAAGRKETQRKVRKMRRHLKRRWRWHKLMDSG